MGVLKLQNPKKAKKERIDTLFKKACLLSRIFLHNPPKKGRIALLIEYDKKWQVFLSEEHQKWPIKFKSLIPADVRYVKDIRTEKEAKEDLEVEQAVATGLEDEAQELLTTLESDSADDSPSPLFEAPQLRALEKMQASEIVQANRKSPSNRMCAYEEFSASKRDLVM